MTDDTTSNAPAQNSTGDAPGQQSGEEKTVRELIADLSADDLDELLISAAPDKFVAKERVEEIVEQRLNSEREQRKAEAERKALEEQNKFKELYETEQAERQKLEEATKASEEARKQDLVRYELRDALRGEGINAERMDLAFRLADTSTVEINGSEVRGVDGVVKQIKDSSPEWFGSTEPATPRGVPPTPIAHNTTQTEQDAAAQQARADARRSNRSRI